MPTFIPARGRTLHVAGVCINRIGKKASYMCWTKLAHSTDIEHKTATTMLYERLWSFQEEVVVTKIPTTDNFFVPQPRQCRALRRCH